ncbi:MAG: 3-dehydroquinate synthase [Firmicutes bacterium]|nr:3-dehydroquinate synthase [Bacillota bacterium]
MQRLQVKLVRQVDDSYEIIIGRHLLEQIALDLQDALNRARWGRISRIAWITDDTVDQLYGQLARSILAKHAVDPVWIVVPAGERHKTRETKARIEDQLIAADCGRDTLIVAHGGGMVSDLGGFVAATFCRGVPYVTVATTLLAAADAAIGGKTAVDTPAATNLIGAFHQPKRVYIDLSAWRTLPAREVRSGLAETIKHACIADAEFFSYLEQRLSPVLDGPATVLADDVCDEIARRNCEIKYRFIEADEREQNLRQVLNLGHTVGRALETAAGYELLHGEAVAVGLAAQADLAVRLGVLATQDRDRLRALLARVGFALTLPAGVSVDAVMAAMRADKKVRAGKIHFVLMEAIGRIRTHSDGSVAMPIDESAIRELLTTLI